MTAAWVLPRQAVLQGQVYTIQTDYRDILQLMHWLGGTADQQLTPEERWYIAMTLFYPDFAAMPRALWADAAAFLRAFLLAGRPEPEASAPPLMDWQQDAPWIAAGIRQAAGCDVRSLPYLHWWSFLACFDAIGQGGFATIVSIREKLCRGKRLEPWELEFYRTHRTAVELHSPAATEQNAEKQRLLALLDGKKEEPCLQRSTLTKP